MERPRGPSAWESGAARIPPATRPRSTPRGQQHGIPRNKTRRSQNYSQPNREDGPVWELHLAHNSIHYGSVPRGPTEPSERRIGGDGREGKGDNRGTKYNAVPHWASGWKIWLTSFCSEGLANNRISRSHACKYTSLPYNNTCVLIGTPASRVQRGLRRQIFFHFFYQACLAKHVYAPYK